MTPHLKRLIETIQMRGHIIWFGWKIRKIIIKYSLLSRAQWFWHYIDWKCNDCGIFPKDYYEGTSAEVNIYIRHNQGLKFDCCDLSCVIYYIFSCDAAFWMLREENINTMLELFMFILVYFVHISIFHGRMVWLEKSVTRVTDRHYEACWVMPNSDREWWIFLSTPMIDAFSCITSDLPHLIFKVELAMK